MKLKTNILFSLLLCGTFATAQNLKLDILPPSVTLGQDSATVFMKMTLNVPQMDTKSHIRLTPVLTDGTRTAELPQILLNGERAHRLYRRTLALNKRKGKADVTPVFTAIPPDRQRSDYPLPCFPSGSRLDTVRHTEPQEGSHQRQRRESTKRKYPHSGHSTPYSNSNRSFRSPTGQEPGSSYGSSLTLCPRCSGTPFCFPCSVRTLCQTVFQGKLRISRKRCHR